MTPIGMSRFRQILSRYRPRLTIYLPAPELLEVGATEGVMETMSIKSDAAREARSLLASEWTFGESEYPLPVDPYRIAKGLGIESYEVELDRDVSGALLKQPTSNPTIYVNASDPPNRRRFSCAHELGHYIKRLNDTHGYSGDEEYGYVDLRSPASSTGTDPDEVFANQFAAELLMPRDRIERLRSLGYTAASLAAEFGVSAESMSYRLDSLRLS